MKSTLMSILKVFLALSVLAIIVLLILGLVLYLDWPWWVALSILLGLAGLTLAILFLRRLWARRREQDFVDKIIEQDEAHAHSLAEKDKEYSRELQARWKEAIDALRTSHLKRLGNPLYVLPWYLVMGESGSGKTTSIKSARLSSPFTEVSTVSGISGTRNCDWWFFEQAVIIDTAGRYAIPIDEGRDKDEWQRFLKLLVKYRKKEPLNGLIVSIAADKALQSTPEALQEDGRNIRRRINELMLVLGAKFPVYVLVTKCDLIQGMTQFCNKLPEANLNQAMGGVNSDFSADAVNFHSGVMHSVGERLRDLRLLLLHHSDSKTVDPGLLLFPEEFEKLEAGLGAFIKAAFQENPYQETPVLRGVYFSSGRQEGSPYSHFLNELGLIGERDILPGTNKGLFLHDFFSRILPGDRGLFSRTRRWIEWRSLTTSLGLTAWLAILLALCGILSFSFFKNLKTLREFSHVFAAPPELSGTVPQDLMTMEKFRDAILKMEERNRNWWIPRLGLNESKLAEIELKKRYCNLFEKGFLAKFDAQIKTDVDGFTSETSTQLIERDVVHVIRRVVLLNNRLKDEPVKTLTSKPAPSYWLLDAEAAPSKSASAEVSKRFGSLYPYYLAWHESPERLGKERETLLGCLIQVLETKGLGYYWLVPWANDHGALTTVSLKDFWKGSLSIPEESMIIPVAFTVKGNDLINDFMKEIDSVLPDSASLKERKKEFKEWYVASYVDSWRNFAEHFPKGAGILQGKDEWQQTAAAMPTDQGPYEAFMNRLVVELQPVVVGGSPPEWIRLIYQFQIPKTSVPGADLLKKQGLLNRLTSKPAQVVSKAERAEKALGVPAGASGVAGAAAQLKIPGIDIYQDYRKALSEIGQAAAFRKRAYSLASHVFKEDAGEGRSPFLTSYEDVEKLGRAAGGYGAAGEPYWSLLRGPVDFLWTYTLKETGCYLQEQWEAEVLRQIQESAVQKGSLESVQEEEGFAKKFVGGTAGPFVSWNVQSGYFAKTAMDGIIPFDPAFFKFLAQTVTVTKQIAQERERQKEAERRQAEEQQRQKEQEKDNYPVLIKALPTSANSEAETKPHETILEMHCSSGAQRLENFNYPVQKTFNWAPNACTDVTLEIKVGDISLTRLYGGDNAFPDFLRQFSSGQRTFRARDFPRDLEALTEMGITTISVAYSFAGHQPILALGKKPARAPAPAPVRIPVIAAVSAPRIIVPCWNR